MTLPMAHRRKALLFLISVLVAPKSSFALHRTSIYDRGITHLHAIPAPTRHRYHHDVSLPQLRGGGGADAPTDAGTSSTTNNAAAVASLQALADITKTALKSGPHVHGVAALAAVATATVVPLALYRQSYAFAIGCGASLATMSLAMMSSFGVPAGGRLSAPALLVDGALFHGIRLATLNALKDVTAPPEEDEELTVGVFLRLRRIPLATTVAILYAFMACPVLYALRAGGEGSRGAASNVLQWAGVVVAYTGMIVSAVSDVHKYVVERRKDASGDDDKVAGPTGGLYRLCRHPNYVGEALFWVGLYVGGALSFGGDATAWVCATLGLSGIVSIMLLPWILHQALLQIKLQHVDTMEEPTDEATGPSFRSNVNM